MGLMTYKEVKYVTTIVQIAQKWGLVKASNLGESCIMKWSEKKKDWDRLKMHITISWVTTNISVKDTHEKPIEEIMWNCKQYFINLKGGKNGERYKEYAKKK